MPGQYAEAGASLLQGQFLTRTGNTPPAAHKQKPGRHAPALSFESIPCRSQVNPH